MSYLDHDQSIYRNPETGEEIVTDLDQLKKAHLNAAEYMLQKLQLALEQHPTKKVLLLAAQKELVRFQHAISVL